jgi:pilus assembly protein FimV
MQTKNQRGNDMPQPAADQELEKYGVWVKAEPQDIIEEPETEHEILGLDTEPSFDADDGAKTDGSDGFDLPDVDEESSILDIETIGEDGMELSMDGFEEDIDEGIIDDSVIDIPLDDLDDFDPTPMDSDSGSSISFDLDETESAEEAPPSSDDLETTDISLDDFGFSLDEDVEDKGKSPAAEESSAPEMVDLSEFGLEDEDAASESALESDDFDAIEMDLQFDDTIPSPAESEEEEGAAFSLDDVEDFSSEPEAVSAGEFDGALSSESFSDLPSSAEAMEDVTADFENLSTSTLGADKPAAERKVPGKGLDSFIDDEDGSEKGILPDLHEENVRFDDVQAFESELGYGGAKAGSEAGPSSDLLKTIASELAAIKDELVTLRGQLGSMKAAQAQAGSNQAELAELDEEGPAGGFFDEEEDDTIALTGDELDNILNTADFTEEPVPSEHGPSADEGALDILPESGDYGLPSAEAGDDDIGIETFGAEDLELAAESVEVTPLTVLDEDTSYLEAEDADMLLDESPLTEPGADELIVESPDGESIELSDFTDETLEAFDDELPEAAVPSIELDDAGAKLEEPPLEPSEDDILDFEDDELEIEEFGDDDEIVLSFEGDESAEKAADDFAGEALPEIEEELGALEELPADDGEFNMELHTEENLPGSDDFSSLEGDDGIVELEELEELEEFDLAEEDFSTMDQATVKPAVPVDVHPDEISMSLDDSFFVEPEEKKLDLSSPTEIKMPSFGTQDEVEPFSLDEEEGETVELMGDDEPLPAAAEPPKAPAPAAPAPAAKPAPVSSAPVQTPDKLKSDIKSVLVYLDQLLASLPEEKIEEFASSEYYDTYKKLFDELGLI